MSPTDWLIVLVPGLVIGVCTAALLDWRLPPAKCRADRKVI